MPSRLILLLLAAILPSAPLHAETLQLDQLTWQPVAPNKLGINLNYLLDGAIPEAQLQRELTQSGARWLRFPGGEKSDNHLWSIPPYERPQPRTALDGAWNWPTGDKRFFPKQDGKTWAINPLDFDEFMRLCRRIGAEPIIVVAQEAAFKPKDDQHGSISEETLIEAAVAWVRYAKTKGYRVRYWEIGNEPYLNGTQPAADFAASWTRFARAMKAADPDILIGVNGPNQMDSLDSAHPEAGPWWPGFIEHADVSPDWISLHDYPCYEWMSYDHYATHPVKTLTGVTGLTAAINKKFGATRATPIPLLVTETNSADWFGHPEQLGWKHDSSLGHGLVLFDMLGQYLIAPQIISAQVWNSRWLNNATAPQLWDVYAPDGTLLPTGRALALWHDPYPAELATVPTQNQQLRIYAGRGAQAGQSTLYLINKSLEPTQVELPTLPKKITHWSGQNPNDPAPTLTPRSPTRLLDLPPHSLTVIKF